MSYKKNNILCFFVLIIYNLLFFCSCNFILMSVLKFNNYINSIIEIYLPTKFKAI